jgi:hypothetical protein
LDPQLPNLFLADPLFRQEAFVELKLKMKMEIQDMAIHLTQAVTDFPVRKTGSHACTLPPMDIPCWLLDIQSFSGIYKPSVLGNNL